MKPKQFNSNEKIIKVIKFRKNSLATLDDWDRVIQQVPTYSDEKGFGRFKTGVKVILEWEEKEK